MRYSGKFYVLEGIDGTGKTEHATRLAKEFGLTHFFDPGSTVQSNAIRKLLLEVEGMSQSTRALLYTAARNEFVLQKLIPALKAGQNVICERYYFSTMVYQHGALPWSVFNELHSNMPKPDKVIFLDIDPEVAMRRDANPDEASIKGKGIEFFSEHNSRYRNVIKGHNSTIVNANPSLDEVYLNIVRVLARENPNLFG